MLKDKGGVVMADEKTRTAKLDKEGITRLNFSQALLLFALFDTPQYVLFSPFRLSIAQLQPV